MTLLQLFAIIVFIYIMLMAPILYYHYRNFSQRFKFLLSYQGPGHEDLAVRIAELIDEKERMILLLEKAKTEHSLMRKRSKSNDQTISTLKAEIEQAKKQRYQHNREWLELNSEMQMTKKELSKVKDELQKNQVRQGRPEAAETRKASMFAVTEKKRREAEEDSEMANVKAIAAIEKARMEKEHNKALSAAVEKSNAYVTTIAELQARVESLIAEIQCNTKAKTSETDTLTTRLNEAFSDLTMMGTEKNELAASFEETSSKFKDLRLQKERLANDLLTATSDLKASEAGRKQMEAAHAATLTRIERNATAEKKKFENDLVQAQAYARRLEQEFQSLRGHVCDHTLCQQQLQKQLVENTNALRNEAYWRLKESNDAHEVTKQTLSSIVADLNALKAIHAQCAQPNREPTSTGDEASKDSMDVEQPATDNSNADDMEVDPPQNILITRLEEALQKIGDLEAEKRELIEVLQGNRSRDDVVQNRRNAATEERIRNQVREEYREEYGSLQARVNDQQTQLRKKDEQLKMNNSSERLQAELEDAMKRGSKLQWDLDVEKAKVLELSTAPKEGTGQAKSSAREDATKHEDAEKKGLEEANRKLAADLKDAKGELTNVKGVAKRVNREMKAAKDRYERCDMTLLGRNRRACEELRDAEKIRSELGVQIQKLEHEIEKLEARISDEPRPAANPADAAPASTAGDKKGGAGEKSGNAGERAKGSKE